MARDTERDEVFLNFLETKHSLFNYDVVDVETPIIPENNATSAGETDYNESTFENNNSGNDNFEDIGEAQGKETSLGLEQMDCDPLETDINSYHSQKTIENTKFDFNFQEDDDIDEDDDDNDTEEDLFEIFNTNGSEDPLCRGVGISMQASILLHLQFARRHNLTKAALKDLLILTRLHLPKPNQFPTSLERLYSCVNLENNVTKYFYCKNCLSLVNEEKLCKHCGCDVAKGSFLFNDVENSLSKLIAKPGFQENLIKPKINNEQVIRDVFDGQTYQNLIRNGYFNEKGLNLTCQMNSDGVSLFKSSSFSVWPVYLRINELPPALRKLKKYRILAGLWFGQQKPYMRSFLRPVVDNLKRLTTGTQVRCSDSEEHHVKLTLLSGLFDLPAKCLVQDMVQFNGYHGCSCCETEGESVAVGKKGSKVVFPLEDGATPRTHLRTYAQAAIALESNQTVFGVRGFPIVGELPHLDVIWNIPYDYMHGAFLGVARSLTRLWLDTSNSKKPWYLGRLADVLDLRLVKITPPDEVSRLPRSLVMHRNYYKANEYRNWLLYYAPIILKNVLCEPYYSHFILLVDGIFQLQKEEISFEDVNSAEDCLKLFVYKMDKLYGKTECKANIHNLVHYGELVRINGPLWASMSGFDYENWNGDFKYLFHGTQKIEQQVMQAVNVDLKLPEIASKLKENTAELMFYRKLLGISKQPEKRIETYGPFKAVSHEDFATFIQEGDELTEFHKLRLDGTILKSAKYARSPSRQNNAVIVKIDENPTAALINSFIQVNNGQYILAVVDVLEKAVNSISGFVDGKDYELKHIKAYNRTNGAVVVNVDDIILKKICIVCDNITYFVDFVNTKESD